MRLLIDDDIKMALQNPKTAAVAYVLDGDPPQAKPVESARVRSASLDLTIGEIFVPGTSPDELGGSKNARREHNLKQGHTAVIRTGECLRMGRNRAAVAFPPAHISLRGLLMTNPGHIDPGYEGPLHCTVINMGRDSFFLNKGLEIMRVLFFELDDAKQAVPSTPLPKVQSAISGQSPISPDLLQRLSTDFVDVEKRAKSIANSAVSKATVIAAGIPIVVAGITVVGSFFFPPLQAAKEDIMSLKSDLGRAATKLEEKADIYRLDVELADLKAQIESRNQVDGRLRTLEDKVNALTRAPQSDRNGNK